MLVDQPSNLNVKNITAEDMDDERLVTYPTEAFFSREYLEAEKKLLWPKVWLMVERETDRDP